MSARTPIARVRGLGSAKGGTHHWWMIFGMYGLAKVFEMGDRAVFEVGGYLSGHTIKHLFAGGASWFIYRHLRTRAPLSNHGATPDRPA